MLTGTSEDATGSKNCLFCQLRQKCSKSLFTVLRLRRLICPIRNVQKWTGNGPSLFGTMADSEPLQRKSVGSHLYNVS